MSVYSVRRKLKSRSVRLPFSQVAFSVEYLIIGGGGPGAATSVNIAGAGGGAGGYRSSISGESSGGGASAETPINMFIDLPYIVTVGAGGPGAGTNVNNTVGSSSVLLGRTAQRGGRATLQGANGGNGGSGSGGSGGSTLRLGGTGALNQGYAGGNSFPSATVSPAIRAAGGGGGASAVGATATSNVGGKGGNGVASSVTGTSVTRAGGGGGSTTNAGNGTQGTGGAGGGGAGRIGDVVGFSGDPNTGSGGGGVGTNGGTATGGSGGSGIVILKYPKFYTATFSVGVTQTTSTVGDFKVSQITATSTTSETVTFA